MSIEATEHTVEILERFFLPLFGEVDDRQKKGIIDSLELVPLRRGDYLFMQEEEADGMYVVLSGKLEAIVSDTDGVETVVGYISRSETVGEMALLSGDKRSAAIRCYRNALLAKLTNVQFTELTEANPAFAVSVAKIVVQRLRQTQSGKKQSVDHTSLMLVNADMDDSTAEDISALVDRYRQTQQVMIIDRVSIDREIGSATSEHLRHTRIDHYITDCEADYDRLFFDISGMDDDMAAYVADYCDLIVIFKKKTSDPVHSPIESMLYGALQAQQTKMRMVLCHDADTESPEGTTDILSIRPRMMHAHIHHGDTLDIDRLHRYLSGQCNVVVLGGGGAKGLAHIGMLRAMAERGIPIDYIVGTSMGAIVAALYAKSRDTEKMHHIARRFFLNNSPTKFTQLNLVPLRSVYRDRRVNSQLRELFGDMDIEDLWLPFFCVSSNISAPKMEVHESGNVAQAVRASMSVPGLFPPVVIDNQLHVDGALFNNIPIDIAMQKNVGKIYACRVDKEEPSDDAMISTPPMHITFVKSTLAYSDSHSQRLLPYVDVYFEPEMTQYGLLSWSAYDKIVEEGYRHAVRVLDDMEAEA